jgi:GntR family transcriptional regulator of arabinose operon
MSEQAVRISKHQLISRWILESIRSGTIVPGDKLPSESELCTRFTASRSAVRQAIAGLANDGWLKSQKGIGTFCVLKDRPLTMDIGLVCFFSSSYIFPRISRGCDEVAHRRGFHILLNQSEYKLDKEREILTKLQKRGVDGIVIEPVFDGAGPSNVELLAELDRTGIPLILIDNYFPDHGFTRVAMDDRAAGRLVASHLWGKGHRDVGILCDCGYLPKRLRREGAESWLAEAGAAPRAEWHVSFQGPIHSGDAARALEAFFISAGPKPTAFICTSDEEAMELYKAAERHGVKIPDQLSVASFDNSSLADLPGISLTSVDHPGHYMGELATQLLLERVLNPGVASVTSSLIAPRLVERGSVKEINRQGS